MNKGKLLEVWYNAHEIALNFLDLAEDEYTRQYYRNRAETLRQEIIAIEEDLGELR